MVARINKQRSVEIRLLNGEGCIPCGNVTIPSNHTIPQVGQVIEVRYLYAHRQSNVLYQPTYLGPRDDVEQAECLLNQIKYKSEEEACSINRSKVKLFALEMAKGRTHKFTRVGGDFFVKCEGQLKEFIRNHVHRLPSKGKTIT